MKYPKIASMVMMMVDNNQTVLQEGKYWELLNKRRRREASRPKKLNEQDKKKRVKQWCTFYRRNINIYIAERLRVKLHPFQHIMLFLMGRSQTFWAICSRGISKTFGCSLFAVAHALLYSNDEIIIVSSAIRQANLIVTEKIEKEMMSLSPILRQMKEDGLIWFKNENDCRCMYFWNGSSIKVLPEEETSRGNRACILIAEEAGKLTKSKYDSIFREMLRPRSVPYRLLPEYQDEIYADKAKEIFLTSAYFKSHWIWTAFKKCVSSCYNDRYDEYNFYAGDIFVAIYHGIKSWTEYRKAKNNSDELSFRMETLNEMVGEADGAYFTLEMFQKNQILTKALRPPTNAEFNAGVDLKNRKKKANEYRILAVDLAFTENAEAKAEEADRCALAVICVICKQDGTVSRNLEYLDSMSGGDDKAVQQRMRELYWDLEIDYILFDVNSGGENYFNSLTTPWEHPERTVWNSHGFGLCNEADLQFVAQGKINEYRQRTVDPEAIPCLIPIRATTELNSNMWKSLWKALNNGTLRLLEDELQLEKKMDNAKYTLMTSEEKMLFRNPYVQTSMLIAEGINLSQIWNNGTLTLKQPRTGHKDRMTSLQYGNALADKIENKYAISQHQDDFDIDDYLENLVF